MKYQVKTAYKPVKIKVEVNSPNKVDLAIIGYDPNHIATVYFNRSITLPTEEPLYFPCPKTPRKLYVDIFDREKGNKVNPKTFTVNLFEVKKLTENNRHQIPTKYFDDIKFIENFSLKAGYLLSNRRYESEDALIIDYLPSIRRDDGTLHTTPARIHKQKNVIQVSKKHFLKMTVPMRIAILLHEYSHNYINITQDSEFEADYNAMGNYTKLGYPDIEAIYAFTKMFPDEDSHVERVRSIFMTLRNKGYESKDLEGMRFENSII